jgi:hypothetical protein
MLKIDARIQHAWHCAVYKPSEKKNDTNLPNVQYLHCTTIPWLDRGLWRDYVSQGDDSLPRKQPYHYHDITVPGLMHESLI